MKPVLVTGATGFLGRHLVNELVKRGQTVRALCRSAADFGPKVEVVRGDVTDAASVEAAVAGASAVYHLAGVVSRDPADAPVLHKVHVEGTRLVCEAAQRQGIARVVYASSSGTIAVSRDPVEHDENSGYKEAITARWPYYVSKIEAEKLALTFGNVIVINPALLLGPGDDRESSTGDIAALIYGEILSLPTGGMCFVDARDCAAGAIAAMERGRTGERYLLGGPNWRFARLAKTVGLISNAPMPSISSPTWLSLAVAPLLRKLMPLIGKRFDIDNTTIEMAGMFWYCDSGKARRELGFTTREPFDTLRDTIADIRARRAEGRAA